MSSPIRLAASLVAVVAAVTAAASGSIALSPYPALSVADGRSTVTITAVVRDSGGDKVANGTLVRFSTTKGNFREWDVQASSGVARAVLVAPHEPGVVKVTASAPSIGVVNSVDVEFVKDRSELASVRHFVEVESGEHLFYSPEIKVISASGVAERASLKYRDIRVSAEDVQVDIAGMWVTASNAVLTVGDATVQCRQLRYNLMRRRGVAIATVDGRTGGYQVTAGETSLAEGGVNLKDFEFADVGTASSSIHADRIVAFPNREVQFHNARLYVGDTKVMGMPLYAINPNSQEGLFSNQVVGFSNGGFQLDYPYYLRLSPSLNSALRLRSGQDYARGAGSSRGFFLDWENNYMLGEAGEGSFVLSGVGRRDMGASWRHSHRFDDRTNAHVMLDFPSFKSAFGGLSAIRSFDGFSLNLSANSTKSLRGARYESSRMDLSLETEMRQVGDLPVRHSVGLTANSSRAAIGTTRSALEGYGLRSRWVLMPQPLWQGANLTGAVTLSQLWGNRSGQGFGVLGTTSVVTPLGPGASMAFTYDYAADSFTSALTGRHRVSSQVSMNFGQFDVSLLGGKSLDIDATNLFADAMWEVSGLWRLGGSFSFDRYRGSSVVDRTLVLGYRLGLREVALTYSLEEGRFGFELLNAPIR